MTTTEAQAKTIDGRARTVRELLDKAKYAIDLYQREYAWQERQVRELIDDLTGKFLTTVASSLSVRRTPITCAARRNASAARGCGFGNGCIPTNRGRSSWRRRVSSTGTGTMPTR